MYCIILIDSFKLLNYLRCLISLIYFISDLNLNGINNLSSSLIYLKHINERVVF